MKVYRLKTILFATVAAFLLAAIGATFAASPPVYADSSSYAGSGATEFVFSAEFTPEENAEEARLCFSAGETGFAAVANVAEGLVSLRDTEGKDLKRVGYDFGKEKFVMTLVYNEETAKIYIGDSDVALLVIKIGETAEWKADVETKGDFTVKKVSFNGTDTLDGDIFCLGYEVLKVVNLSDHNYKLTEKEYSVEKGVLTVSQAYLNTLETGKTYSFRAVTSRYDLDFDITTDFLPVSAYSLTEKYYRDSDVSVEMSRAATVYKATIDEKETAFTQSGAVVKFAASDVNNLTAGKHVVKLYTDSGRPEATFSVAEAVETMTEMPVKATHLFFWIDVAIFASLILGYAGFTVIKKAKA